MVHVTLGLASKVLVLAAPAALVSAALAADTSDYLHAEEEIGSVEQVYDGRLEPDLAVSTFRNIDRLFPTRTVEAGGEPRALPESERRLDTVAVEIGERTYDLYDALALNSVTGLIVLKDGEVVYESYQRGNRPETRWMSMSVVKSITSTLVGAAIRDGHIESLDDDVTRYVEALRGSAYEGVRVRDILLMASGVQWDETYTDPASDRRDLLRAQIAQEPGGLMAVMAALPRAGEPGTVHTYSTGETQVLGEVVIGATGMPLAQYLSEKIWTPYGMEADATWWLESPDGNEIGGSGLSATLRDFARFGQFFLEGGVIDGEAILPDGWAETAGRPQDLSTGETIDYGYMWWPAWTEPSIEDGAFAAVGIQGQYVYINPAADVVIAMTAAQPKPLGREPVEAMAFFDAIVAEVR
jgi:CubicO group peptidase (beta-lactamase class C family)